MRIAVMLMAALLSVAALACSSNEAASPATAAADHSVRAEAAPAPLLFGIGMHIEPLGATAQRTSQAPSGAQPAPGTRSADYNLVDAFERGVTDIKAVAAIVEQHGGQMTVQAQSPFTTTAAKTGSTVLSDLQDSGHEIGLHFHEDAHLGKDGNGLPAERWCQVMKDEIGYIHQAGVEGAVSYWSGGNLYPHLLEAATCAGLSVNSDWKNPGTQQTDASLIGTVPWRPAGSTNGTDTSAFAAHDPNGKVVFLPEGNYDRGDFAASRRSESAGGDDAYFQYLEDQLLRSIETARPGNVNVFHFTVHPGEFRGGPGSQFGVIERFLAEVVDPLVREGKVKWATFSEMAAAFQQWEKANPGIDPRASSAVAAPEATAATTPAAETPAAGGRLDRSKAGRVDRNVTYCTAGNTALKMDVYYPAVAAKPGPAVLYVHGGGWTAGSKNAGTGSEIFPTLAARGYLVAAVDYRLAPEYPFPAQIEDVKCAVRFLRANAAKYNVDPGRIGAYGGSAGGHLVALLGVTDGSEGLEGTGGYTGVSSRVQAVVDMFGPSDLVTEFEGASDRLVAAVFGASGRDDPVLRTASPVTWVSGDDPPFLILHGDSDTLVPLSQSQELYEKLRAAGVESQLVVVKNAGHGFAPSGGSPDPTREQLSKMVADFFDRNLK